MVIEFSFLYKPKPRCGRQTKTNKQKNKQRAFLMPQTPKCPINEAKHLKFLINENSAAHMLTGSH